jgi:hypothetical protein
MAGSDNARWATHFLEQATDGDPGRADLASTIASVGVGFALLAIADAIENHAAALRGEQNNDLEGN